MAYGTKYKATIQDFTGNTYTVSLKKLNYTGQPNIIDNGNVTLSYRGNGRDETAVVIPSETNFNFYVYPEDLDRYDEIFESSPREWQLQIEKGSGQLVLGTGLTLTSQVDSDSLSVDTSGSTNSNGWQTPDTARPEVNYSIYLAEDLPGTTQWAAQNSTWIDDDTMESPDVAVVAINSGNTGSFIQVITGATIVKSWVFKLNASGVTSVLRDNTSVRWYRNGILEEERFLPTGLTPSNLRHNYLNISAGDYFQVKVSEKAQLRTMPIRFSVSENVEGLATWHMRATSASGSQVVSTTTNGSQTANLSIQTDGLIDLRVTRSGTTDGAGSVTFSQTVAPLNVGEVKKTTDFDVNDTVDTSYIFTATTSVNGIRILIQESYTTPPPPVTNTGTGSGTISPGGGNLQAISIGGFGFTYATSPIPIGSSTQVTVTPLSSIVANATPLIITLQGQNAISVNSYTMKVTDTTTSTDYGPSISGNQSNFVVISFNVPAVSNHTFQLSGNINITGG